MTSKTKHLLPLILFTLFLSACGGPAATVAPTLPPVETAEPAFPVTIEHKFGSTTITMKPERVVTIGWNDQDFVIALGVVPVSTRAWFDEYQTYPWVAPVLNGNELKSFGGEINLEAIANEKPDLILAIYDTIDQDLYDKFSQIASTVVQSAEYADEATPWDVQTLTTGKALGKLAEAQALVDKVNARVAEIQAEHPEFVGKTLVVDYGPGVESGHWLIGVNDPRRALFDALGFEAQSEAGEISYERADLLDRDVLFVIGATEEELTVSPIFAQLNVVKSGGVIYTTFDTPLAGALSYSGPNALLYALDL